MERIDYGVALLRRWWLLVVLGLVGALIGLLLAPRHAKTTVSSSKWQTTTLVGAVPPAGPGASGVLGGGVGTNQILFYAHKGDVISAAAAAAGLKNTPQLDSTITVTGPTNKNGQVGVVKLSTVASTPAKSAAFTNAFANKLGDYLNNLAKLGQSVQLQAAQQRVTALQARIAILGAKASPALVAQLNSALAQVQELSTGPSPSGYSVLQKAQASSAVRVGGKTSGLPSGAATWGVIGLLIGALLGAGIVLLIEVFDKRLRNSARAEELFGYRVVAEIPIRGKADAPPSLLSRSAPGPAGTSVSPHDEAYRKLHMSVLLEALEPSTAPGGRPPTPGQRLANGAGNGAPGLTAPATRIGSTARQLVLVVSAGAEPSRSAVVDNLAAAYADAGQQVLVVSTLDLPSGGGGGQQLAVSGDVAPADLKPFLQPSVLENVSLLSLANVIGNSGQLLTRAPAVLSAARRLADVLIVQTPPILAFHDGEALASVADVVLVVGECGTTTFDQARRAGLLLRRIDAPVLGVVLTNVRLSARQVRSAEAVQQGERSQLEPERRPDDSGLPAATPVDR